MDVRSVDVFLIRQINLVVQVVISVRCFQLLGSPVSIFRLNLDYFWCYSFFGYSQQGYGRFGYEWWNRICGASRVYE